MALETITKPTEIASENFTRRYGLAQPKPQDFVRVNDLNWNFQELDKKAFNTWGGDAIYAMRKEPGKPSEPMTEYLANGNVGQIIKDMTFGKIADGVTAALEFNSEVRTKYRSIVSLEDINAWESLSSLVDHTLYKNYETYTVKNAGNTYSLGEQLPYGNNYALTTLTPPIAADYEGKNAVVLKVNDSVYYVYTFTDNTADSIEPALLTTYIITSPPGSDFKYAAQINSLNLGMTAYQNGTGGVVWFCSKESRIFDCGLNSIQKNLPPSFYFGTRHSNQKPQDMSGWGVYSGTDYIAVNPESAHNTAYLVLGKFRFVAHDSQLWVEAFDTRLTLSGGADNPNYNMWVSATYNSITNMWETP